MTDLFRDKLDSNVVPLCTSIDDMKVPVATTIVYCYTVRNTGDVTLNTHSLVDSHLGQLLTNVDHVLVTGATFATTLYKFNVPSTSQLDFARLS